MAMSITVRGKFYRLNRELSLKMAAIAMVNEVACMPLSTVLKNHYDEAALPLNKMASHLR